jgi:hypothetical protein
MTRPPLYCIYRRIRIGDNVTMLLTGILYLRLLPPNATKISPPGQNSSTDTAARSGRDDVLNTSVFSQDCEMQAREAVTTMPHGAQSQTWLSEDTGQVAPL